MYAHPLRLIPYHPTLDAWKKLFQTVLVMKWLWNSALVAGLGTAINVVICSLAGYAFARIPFRGRNVLYRAVISTLMLPLTVYIVPLYIIMNKLKLINTYWSLVIPVSDLACFCSRNFSKTCHEKWRSGAD